MLCMITADIPKYPPYFAFTSFRQIERKVCVAPSKKVTNLGYSHAAPLVVKPP